MGRKRKILIVDDNESILTVLDAMLRKGGYEVVSAGNGVEAIEKLRKDPIDIIISDILMPGMDGFQFCRMCQQDDSLKSIPFVFLSATYTDKKDKMFATGLGAAKFIVKPVKYDVLLDTLKTVIEEHDNSAPVTLEKPMDDEKVYLAEYNKRLVEKLEEKVLDLGKEIDERKSAQEKIKASLKEKETLLMEIHHRVRNNLQVISSLLLLHTRYLKDEQSIKVFKNAQDRIQSMAIIHEILYESSHMSNIDFVQFTQTLTDRLFNSYGIDPAKISLKINIKDISLKIEQAVPLGLLVNELFSNSLEHAFPFDKIRTDPSDSDEVKQEEYKIRMSLTPAPDNKVELLVCDNGVGMPKDLDLRTTDSLGLSLVNIIAENQLKGEVALDRSVKGTKFQIIF